MKPRTLLAGLLLILFASTEIAQRAQANPVPVIGPYTEINLPLEDLPSIHPQTLYNPVIDDYPGGASLQILYVVEDPRDVPLARFGYWDQRFQAAVGPIHNIRPDHEVYNEIIAGLEKIHPQTINVYLRVQAPDNTQAEDPLINVANEFDRVRPALNISSANYLDSPESDLLGESLRCAALEYAGDTAPYPIPDLLEGGDTLNDQGLYDPKAYAPPRPWYPYQDKLLEPGEVREGWISCLAPDEPLAEIEIYSYYTSPAEATPTPEPTAPSPAPEDACVLVESFDDPLCNDPDINCCLGATPAPVLTEFAPIFTEAAASSTQENAAEIGPQLEWNSFFAWNFNAVSTFPEEGVKVEDVVLKWSNPAGETLSDVGDAVFKSVHIVQEEISSNRYRYHLVAEVEVEPSSLTAEELSDFSLLGVDADIRVYETPRDASRIMTLKIGWTIPPGEINTSWKNNLQETWGEYTFTSDTISPLKGYVFSLMEPFRWDRGSGPQLTGRIVSKAEDPDNQPGSRELPSDLWVTINARIPDSNFTNPPHYNMTRYPAQGVRFTPMTHTASTTMCDVVDCLDVVHVRDKDRVERTVPILCPGEWGNNLLITGMRSKAVDYFGESPGLKTYPKTWAHTERYDTKTEIWFFDGKILGGLTPWWLDGDKTYSSEAWSNNLEGQIVDANTGTILDLLYREYDIDFLPVYAQLPDQNIYYAPVRDTMLGHGWMPGLVEENLVIAGPNYSRYISSNYTGDIPEVISFDDKLFLFEDEGPLWDQACTRTLLENHATLQRYAPPNAEIDTASSEEHILTRILPGMDYPLTKPRMDGEIFELGENGIPLFGYTLKPTDVKIIPGRANKSIIYVPEEDHFYPAEKRVSDNNQIYFLRMNAVSIPPGNSLVLVKIVKDPPGGPVSCGEVNHKIFQISYPGYYPVSSQPGAFLRYTIDGFPVCPEDFTETWLIFKLPLLEIKMDNLLFTMRSEEYWNMWKLD